MTKTVICWLVFLMLGPLRIGAGAQQLTPPIPQKLVIHSNLLNEDREVWVRLPNGYDRGSFSLPVLYLTDGPDEINEIGSVMDFLVENSRMPQLVIVGIGNTDRVRDLTPSYWNQKDSNGNETAPTSGGGDHFVDFIQQELMPAIEKRYRVASYRIFAGHSLGGLMAIHMLITRPEMFGAYIAVSPSLQWDNQRTLHQAQTFFAAHNELNKTLFFSLANEGEPTDPMVDGFTQLQATLKKKTPEHFRWDAKRFLDEDHGSTVLLAHYAAFRFLFPDWPVPRDPETHMPVGGFEGLEKHYRELSARYGYAVTPPENTMNGLGYRLMAAKKLDEAVVVLQKNVELYPGSANVYDSLGEAYEAAGKLDLATANFQKAIDIGTKNGDGNLSEYRAHLARVTTEKAAAAGKK